MPAKASIQKSLKFLDSGSRWLPRQLARNDADRPLWSAVKICGARSVGRKMNSNGEIVDVQHPLVSLMILLSGPGNVGSSSIQPGTLLFRFRWK